MNNFSKRLFSLKFHGEKKGDFAKRIGVDRVVLSRYLKGRIPDPEQLMKISEATGVSIHWLLTGRGPKMGPPIPPSMIDNIIERGGEVPGPGANETLAEMTVKPEIAASHILDMGLDKASREALADMVRELAHDPAMRRRVIEFYDYVKFKEGGKKK